MRSAYNDFYILDSGRLTDRYDYLMDAVRLLSEAADALRAAWESGSKKEV